MMCSFGAHAMVVEANNTSDSNDELDKNTP